MKKNSFFITDRNLYFPKKKKTLEKKDETGVVKTNENLINKKQEGENLVSQDNSS